MTTKPNAPETPDTKGKDETAKDAKPGSGEKGKVVTPARMAVGAAIGSAAIAAAVLFASRSGKSKA